MDASCSGFKTNCGVDKSTLDRQTDHIDKTLECKDGRNLFRKFLEKSDFKDDEICLNLYEKIDTLLKPNYKKPSKTDPRVIEIIKLVGRIDDFDTEVADTFFTALEVDNLPHLESALMVAQDETKKLLKDTFKLYVKFVAKKV